MNLRRFVFEYILIKGKVVALSSISLSRIEKRNAWFHLEVDSDGVCARNTQIQVLSPLERWNSTTFIPVYGWFIVWTSYTWWFFLSCVSCIGSHSQHRNAHTRNERTWSRLQDSQMTECIVERTYWILHECTLKRAKHYKEMVKWVETVNKKKIKTTLTHRLNRTTTQCILAHCVRWFFFFGLILPHSCICFIHNGPTNITFWNVWCQPDHGLLLRITDKKTARFNNTPEINTENCL